MVSPGSVAQASEGVRLGAAASRVTGGLARSPSSAA